MSTQDANRRFAAKLFAADADDQGLDDAEQEQAPHEYTEDQRRWAREFFVVAEDAPVLAGLVAGRTVGRTTPPRT